MKKDIVVEKTENGLYKITDEMADEMIQDLRETLSKLVEAFDKVYDERIFRNFE